MGSLEVKLDNLLLKEEIYWKQRSRINWLSEGDRNTAYFHKYATARRKRNSIHRLKKNDDSYTTTQMELENLITDYYSHLFSSQHPSSENISKISNILHQGVTQDMHNYFDTSFSKEEIKKALFDLHLSKALGPDGFTALFFQNARETVEDKVTKATLDVLNNGASLEEWNQTLVTLIPKVKEPNTIQQYRPISLCNVSYKIITRAITNRLKSFTNDIIDPFQSAFIPGIAITDNIIIGYECMHWLKNYKGNQGFAALKLDMSNIRQD